MKRTMILAASAAIGLLFSQAQARAQTAFDGFYAGVGGGAGSSKRAVDLSISSPSGTLTNHARASEQDVAGRVKVFAGYNMTFDRWLVGAELGYQPYLGNEKNAYVGNFLNASSRSRSGMYTVVGRAGYLIQPDLMVYGFGGWAAEQQNTSISNAVSSLSNSRLASGFVGGIGVEYALTSSLFLRGELEYSDIGTKNTYTLTDPTTQQKSSANVRNNGTRFGGIIGIGYRF